MRAAAVILGIVLLALCGRTPGRLTVGAASNLTTAFDEIGHAFTDETGVELVFSYGATSALARQVEAGAPLDVFAAADSEHVDALVASGHVMRDTRAVYARGQLALWAPGGGVESLQDLAGDGVKFVAIAQPELAPYGQAAVEALKAAGLWDAVQPKLVYANNISQAKQFAMTGNADAALTAYSLVFQEPGTVLVVDAKLHQALDQAMGVVSGSVHEAAARQFAAFVKGARGRAILTKNGYLVK
ncbi:MAG: molybdate ABC transporter substrate-binding protein [Acidobacteriota bacterium]